MSANVQSPPFQGNGWFQVRTRGSYDSSALSSSSSMVTGVASLQLAASLSRSMLPW
jgi:hypothetical protein